MRDLTAYLPVRGGGRFVKCWSNKSRAMLDLKWNH